ncbi:MAG: CoA transferase [Chloroflexi bacterium]|nr:CoA transferase [Chloroflexota bacterium]
MLGARRRTRPENGMTLDFAPARLLAPYRVLDLTDETALLAGRILADLGADVIQVEPTGGSSARRVPPLAGDEVPALDRSAYWSAYAANKRGVAIDIAHPAGRELLLRLAASADFLIESAPPGEMARLGLDYKALEGVNPALIHVSVTPFGSTGPKAHWASTDITLWGSGGPLLPQRDDGRPPVRISAPQAHRHAAADAAGGALIAHFARLCDGKGQHVDISVQQSVMEATLSRVLSSLIGDVDTLAAGGVDLPLPTKWEVRDGYVSLTVAMGTSTGHFSNNLMQWIHEEGGCRDEIAAIDWRAMQRVTGEGELDPELLAEVEEVIRAFVADKTKSELMDAAVQRKLMVTPVFTIAEIAASKHLEARDFWQAPPDPPLPGTRLPAFPAKVDGATLPVRRPAPRLGQHTREILVDELGVDDREYEQLLRDGVVG